MKKSTIVLFICLATSAVLAIAGVMINGAEELTTMYRNDDLSISVGSRSDFHEEYRDINNLNFDIGKNDIHIVEHDLDYIIVEGDNVSSSLEIKAKDDTLKIDEDNVLTYIPFINTGGTITIYVPRDKVFDNVDFKVGVGSLNVDKLQANDTEIEVNVGKFNAGTIVTNEISLDVEVGDLTVDLLNAKRSDINCEVGNINLVMVGNEEDYSYDVKVSVGDLVIGNNNFDGVDNEFKNHSGSRKIDANVEVGNVVIKMEG